MKNRLFRRRFIKWRLKGTNNYSLLLVLSVLIGFSTGLLAVVIKNSVHGIQLFVEKITSLLSSNYLYFVFPIIGISLVYIFVKFILRQSIGHGIPSVLFAISRNNGFIKKHNIFSSIISSALTVGFGGSVGLEGPTVATGGAVGSAFGGMFKLDYRQKVLLLGASAAAAMASIFKAPIAGVVFAIEVIMIDLTTLSIIPILLAALSGSIASHLLFGSNYLYSFELQDVFTINQIPYFIILGLVSGFVAVYFTRIYVKTSDVFKKINTPFKKLVIGGGLLGLLIFFFPALYGEGYEYINASLKGNYEFLFQNYLFDFNQESFTTLILLLLAMLLFKIFAASLTFGAGGIGGVFAPTLFTGVNTGLLVHAVSKHFGYNVSASNSALVGMTGLIAGVLQAPLTGIFLIGEITGGYALLLPLMTTATVSFIIVRIFEKNNLYSIQLAKRKELLTHHADKNMLTLLSLENIIETDFKTLSPEQTLGDIVKVISQSERNFFPVIDEENNFLGLISMNRVRKIIFKPELYEDIKVKDLMYLPDIFVDKKRANDPEIIAEKLQKSGIFNIVVLDNHKYVGFISRANFFSHYRSLLKEFSSH